MEGSESGLRGREVRWFKPKDWVSICLGYLNDE